MENPIDFTELRDLAQCDPAAFEKRRAEILEQHIRQAPADLREGLRRTQWAADQKRQRAATPWQAISAIWKEIGGKAGTTWGQRWVRQLERLTSATSNGK